MKATIWIFATTIAATIGGTLAGCVVPALFSQHELRSEAQEMDQKLADRHAFDRFFGLTLNELQRGAIDAHEAGTRILQESRRTFPQYVDMLKHLEGAGADSFTAEELAARNIRSRLGDLEASPAGSCPEE